MRSDRDHDHLHSTFTMSDTDDSSADEMTPPEWAKSVDERLDTIESIVKSFDEEAADADGDEAADADKDADESDDVAADIADTLQRVESKLDELDERVEDHAEEIDSMKSATGVSQQLDHGQTSDDAEKSAWAGVFTGPGGN